VSCFDLIDSVILMSHGTVVYNGPAKDAVAYFIQNPSYGFVRSHSSVGFSIYLDSNASQKTETTNSDRAVNPIDYLLAISMSGSAAANISESDYTAAAAEASASIEGENAVHEDLMKGLAASRAFLAADAGQLRLFWLRGRIIWQRSFKALYRRYKLTASAVVLHVCFALIFPVTLGNSSQDEYGT
jgi:hypothetical protein